MDTQKKKNGVNYLLGKCGDGEKEITNNNHKIDLHVGEHYDFHGSAPFGGSGLRLSRICKIGLCSGGEEIRLANSTKAFIF